MAEPEEESNATDNLVDWVGAWHADAALRCRGKEASTAAGLPAYDGQMRQVRNLIVFVVGLITLFTASVLVGVIVCGVAVLGAIATESRYRRGVPGSATFTGRPPKRPS